MPQPKARLSQIVLHTTQGRLDVPQISTPVRSGALARVRGASARTLAAPRDDRPAIPSIIQEANTDATYKVLRSIGTGEILTVKDVVLRRDASTFTLTGRVTSSPRTRQSDWCRVFWPGNARTDSAHRSGKEKPCGTHQRACAARGIRPCRFPLYRRYLRGAEKKSRCPLLRPSRAAIRWKL